MMDMDAKILNNLEVTGSNNKLKKIIHHDQVGYLAFRAYSIVTKQIPRFITSIKKEKNHMILSIDAEKAFDKIQHPFFIKTLKKVGIEGAYLKIIKAIYE